MQWDLVDTSFFGVSLTTRFVSPINNKLMASSSALALWTLNPLRIISSSYVSKG